MRIPIKIGLFFNGLTLLLAKRSSVGGQAIIEGVMMRGKQKVSWAVRKPSGEILVERLPFVSLSKRSKFFALPIMRGGVNLFESLTLGYKAISRSAEIAGAETDGPPANPLREKIEAYGSFTIAMIFAVGLFMFLPMWTISLLVPKESALAFNIGAGLVRLSLFVLYLYAISRWKEIRRIFEFHGAEHKAIFTYEAEEELTLDNMKKQTRRHPRCGTSFILIVAMICIALFAVIDTAVIALFGPYPTVFARLLVHLVLVPLVAGISYELLKLSYKFQKNPLVGALILPGLWLQEITTREPDETQLTVAASALKAAL
ncbi:MAG: DUF1385 domain-containing protein [Chitinivibrionales bacterium]|nr:DUF1385 domain-containing protein [Chitinivibrionales bacterium]